MNNDKLQRVIEILTSDKVDVSFYVSMDGKDKYRICFFDFNGILDEEHEEIEVLHKDMIMGIKKAIRQMIRNWRSIRTGIDTDWKESIMDGISLMKLCITILDEK